MAPSAVSFSQLRSNLEVLFRIRFSRIVPASDPVER
jgi:hypothetical protein